jgi:hypothetical protein
MRSAVSAGLQLGGAEGERAFAMLRRAQAGGGVSGDRVVALSVRWASPTDWASKHTEATANRAEGVVPGARGDPLEVAVVLGSGLLLRYSVESAGPDAGTAVLFGEDRLVSLDADEDMDTDPVAVALPTGHEGGASGVSAIAAAIASAHERSSSTPIVHTAAPTTGAGVHDTTAATDASVSAAHEATSPTDGSVSAASVASSVEPDAADTASPSD